jgi:hypothetical protein
VQHPEEVADSAGAGALVMPSPRGEGEHAARVTNCQRSDLPLLRPGDNLPGGFMLSLPDPPPVAGFCHPLTPAVFAPPPRPTLTRLGCPVGHRPVPCFGVAQVLAALGAQGSPRHQQSLAAGPAARR